MTLRIYLSGEIHTDWRDRIIAGADGLDAAFDSPVTDHAASDDCGVAILGAEPDKFWHDRKGAMVNAIRTRRGSRRPISSWSASGPSTSNGTRRSTPAAPARAASR